MAIRGSYVMIKKANIIKETKVSGSRYENGAIELVI